MIGQWSDCLTIVHLALEYARLSGDLESVLFIEVHAFCWQLTQQGRYEEAEQYITDALKTAMDMGNAAWICAALINYAQVARRRKAVDQAQRYCQQALQLVTQLTGMQRIYTQASIEYELGKCCRDIGDWQAAKTYFHAARDVFHHDTSDPTFNLALAWGVLGNIGFIEHQLGNLVAAEQMYLQSLGFFRDFANKADMATILIRIAALEKQRGNRDVALEYAHEALEWNRRLGLVPGQTQAEDLWTRLTTKR